MERKYATDEDKPVGGILFAGIYSTLVRVLGLCVRNELHTYIILYEGSYLCDYATIHIQYTAIEVYIYTSFKACLSTFVMI